MMYHNIPDIDDLIFGNDDDCSLQQRKVRDQGFGDECPGFSFCPVLPPQRAGDLPRKFPIITR